MDILGVGPLELIFILLLALIIMGPKDMVKSGRTIGRFLRKNCYLTVMARCSKNIPRSSEFTQPAHP